VGERRDCEERVSEQDEQPPGGEEVGRIEALDERFGRIESEQAEHRGMLERILDRVGGAEQAAHGKAEQHTRQRLEHPPAESVADQVRRAVKDVQAEQEAERHKADHDTEHAKLREAAERPPREPASGVRGKIQRAMFGADQ
jgi:hypothetical protein